MSRLSAVRVHGRAAVLTFAAALYVAIFALRQTVGAPGDGLTFLYIFPIVLVAIELGLASGLIAALVGVGLFGVWDLIEAADQPAIGYLVRFSVFGGVAVLCAQMAARVRRTTEVSDRYFELSSDLLGTADREGRLLRVNGAWERALGWPLAELHSRPIVDFLHPGDRAFARDSVATLVAGGSAEVSHVTRLSTSAGGWRSIEWSLKGDPDSDVVWVAGRDVTEREAVDRARREAEERFRVSFENSTVGMAVVGVEGSEGGRIIECNDVLADLLGVPREDLLGTTGITNFGHPDDLKELAPDMERLRKGDLVVLRREMRIVCPDGRQRWIHLTTSIVHDDEGKPRFRLSQLQDIDDRKHSEERLRHLADHDAMSGLHNRRRWVVELEEELANHAARGSQGAVLAIDLDRFKRVNDSAGHAVGDAVIAAVGRALTGRLRSGDMAGRLGGDEFAVLLRRVDGEDALLVAHGLFAGLEQELAQIPSEVAREVTMSIGVALIDSDASRDADHLLARADAAMYESKRLGGCRVELAIPRAQAGRASTVPPAPSLHAVPRLR